MKKTANPISIKQFVKTKNVSKKILSPKMQAVIKGGANPWFEQD